MVAVAYNSQDVSAFPQRVNDAGNVLASRVVVAGTNAGEVKRPVGANAGKIVGIAGHDEVNGRDVSVYNFGTMNLVAASAIAVGDYVNIADVEGRVKTVSEAVGTAVYVVGIARGSASVAGQYVPVMLQFMRYTA